MKSSGIEQLLATAGLLCLGAGFSLSMVRPAFGNMADCGKIACPSDGTGWVCAPYAKCDSQNDCVCFQDEDAVGTPIGCDCVESS